MADHGELPATLGFVRGAGILSCNAVVACSGCLLSFWQRLQSWSYGSFVGCSQHECFWIANMRSLVQSRFTCVQSQAQAQIQALQEEVAYLRQQLVEQCEAMIEMAQTVSSRLPRIVESAQDTTMERNNGRDSKDAAAILEVRFMRASSPLACHGLPWQGLLWHATCRKPGCPRCQALSSHSRINADNLDMQADYDHTVGHLESQRQTLMHRQGANAAEQAEQLRALENKARKWAKKFLYKVKMSASKAEQQAGILSAEANASPGQLHVSTQRDSIGRSALGRGGTLDTIESLPSPRPRSGAPSDAAVSTPQSHAHERARGAAHMAPSLQPTRMTLQRANAHAQLNDSARLRPSAAGGSPMSPTGGPASSLGPPTPCSPGPPSVAASEAAPQSLPERSPAYAPMSDSTPYQSPGARSAPPSHAHVPASQSARSLRKNRRSLPNPSGGADSTNGRSGRTMVASIQSHLKRSEQRGDSDLTSMLDSARSTELGSSMNDSRKKRFAYFNGLFSKSSSKK